MATQNTGIALANELADVAKSAMMDFEVMMTAAEIVGNGSNLTAQELNDLLFKYSAMLTASVSTRITHTLLTETQIKDMISDIEMFEAIGDEVLEN